MGTRRAIGGNDIIKMDLRFDKPFGVKLYIKNIEFNKHTYVYKYIIMQYTFGAFKDIFITSTHITVNCTLTSLPALYHEFCYLMYILQ